MPAENIGDINRQRAVHIDGHIRQIPLMVESVQQVDQKLGALHGKGRDDNFAAALAGALNDL